MKSEESLLEIVASEPGGDVLSEAVALGDRAALVGFDWPGARDALDKVSEEVEEVREVLDADELDTEALRGELGDLLFAVCMVSRLGGVDPIEALSSTNAKFRARFAGIERELERRGVRIEDASIELMEQIWQAQKRGG